MDFFGIFEDESKSYKHSLVNIRRKELNKCKLMYEDLIQYFISIEKENQSFF